MIVQVSSVNVVSAFIGHWRSINSNKFEAAHYMVIFGTFLSKTKMVLDDKFSKINHSAPKMCIMAHTTKSPIPKAVAFRLCTVTK